MLPLLLIMPVFQTILLSFAANYEIKNVALGVLDADHSPTSRALVQKFTASGYFKIAAMPADNREADEALASDHIDLLLEIPPQMVRELVREQRTSVSTTANAINAVKAGLAIGYAGGILRDYNLEILSAPGTPKPPQIEVT